jgi:hypothetical protein
VIYDNVLTESVNALYKKEVIIPEGPWNDASEVILATATVNGYPGTIIKGCAPGAAIAHHWSSKKPSGKAGSRNPRQQRETEDQVSTKVGAVPKWLLRTICLHMWASDRCGVAAAAGPAGLSRWAGAFTRAC